MDFHCLKRKELQALCKKNNIPANITNAAMADSLSSLPLVEGLEEFMEQLAVKVSESPERSVITSPTLARTTTHRQVTKEIVGEGSKATRTRCGTRRRGLEVTDSRMTPATRTTRNKVAQEASVQKKIDKNMQAEFEADMDSEASETTVLSGVGEEVSEDVITVSAEQEVQNMNEAPNAVLESVHEGQGPMKVDDMNENLVVEADGGVDKEIEEPAEVMNARQKFDFHSLGRKELQSFCKKNKIPANTSNATMASALESLEIVIGLEGFIENYDPEALLSPDMSEMKSCFRRSCTGRKATKEPLSSKLMMKSSRGTRTRVKEEIEEAKNVVCETPAARSTRRKVPQIGSALCKETVQKKEIQTYTRSGALRSVAQAMENSTNAPADEGSLPVVEMEKEHQCQTEAVNVEKAVVLNCDPVSKIGDGIDGLLETENLKQQQESVIENDSNAAVDVDAEGSEVTEQPGSMVNDIEDDSGLSWQLDGLVEERDDGVDGSADISVIVEDDNAKGSREVNETEKDSEILKEVDEKADTVDMTSHVSEVPEKPKDLVNQTEGVEGITSAELQEVPDIPKELGDLVDERDDNVDMNQTEKIVGITSAELEEVLEQTAKTINENVDEASEASGENKSLALDENVDEETDSCLEASEESKGSHEEDQSMEEFDSGSITQDDEPIISDEKVENKYEISLVEEQVTVDSDAYVCPVEDEDEKQQKFVSELPAAEAEPVLAVENKLEREFENTQNEKSEAFAEEKMTVKFDESTILADQCAQKELDTPLCNKSMRKLKKMLKEKLEATTLLAKRMENLTLEECNITLSKAEDEQKENESSELVSMSKSGTDDASVSTIIPQDAGEDSDDETICSESEKASSLLPVDSLLDHELTSKDSVSGQIFDESMTPSKSESKPWKPLLLATPSKSSSRTPLHLDVNKENVDQSASKTEPGINMTVVGSGKLLSAMSMGKLKKEVKNLQQSEKKRHALQARSENCCPLASP